MATRTAGPVLGVDGGATKVIINDLIGVGVGDYILIGVVWRNNSALSITSATATDETGNTTVIGTHEVGNSHRYQFVLIGPVANGGNKDIEVIFDGSGHSGAAYAVSYSGLDATPNGTPVFNSGTGTTLSADLPTEVGSPVFTLTGHTTEEPTPAAGFTAIDLQNVFNLTDGQYDDDAGDGTTMAINATTTVSGGWDMLAIALAPAGGGGAFTLTAEQGSYALTGQAAAVRATRMMPAAQGVYSLSGQDAALVLARALLAAQGAYALSGNDADLRAARAVLAAQGAYSLNGQAAGLVYDAGAEVLNAEAGAYALNGQAANLRAARALLADVGTYALTGQAARLARDASLELATGAYALNGQDAVLTAPAKIVAQFGIYALTGQVVALLYEPAGGAGLADPTSSTPANVKRPRGWEPFDLSYLRWKYARDRERVDVVELAPDTARKFRSHVEDAELEIDEDIEELEAELARYERATARQRKQIGDVEAQIAQVEAVLELARMARRRRQEELEAIVIIIALLARPGSRRS